MTAPQSPYQSHEKELKDYYLAYADILRDIGINTMFTNTDITSHIWLSA